MQPVILVADSAEESKNFEEIYVEGLNISASDIIEFYPEEGVELLRVKISSLQIMPHSSKFRLFVIFSGEKLNKEQANTLLKILEEPPPYARIIIFSSSLSKIISTIKSRCQKYFLPKTNTKEAFDLLSFFETGEFNEFLRAIKDIESEDIPAILEKMMTEIKSKGLVGARVNLYRQIGKALISVSSTNANKKLELERLFIWWKSINPVRNNDHFAMDTEKQGPVNFSNGVNKS